MHTFDNFVQFGSIGYNKFLVIWLYFEYESRYLLKIFSICSSHDCANLTKKIWPLLNQPASKGQFWLKLWMPLATIFVEIFQKEKNGTVLDPLEYPLEKIFQYLFKNGVVKFFERAVGPPSRCPRFTLLKVKNF